MTAKVVVSDAPPATDALDPIAAASDSTSWGLLALSAIGGLLIGRRRFSRPIEAPSND
jgi:MYXO-CTERM domain-containing protein